MRWRPYAGILNYPIIFDPAQASPMHALPQWWNRVEALYEHYGLKFDNAANPQAPSDLVMYMGFRHAGFHGSLSENRNRLFQIYGLDSDADDFALVLRLAQKHVRGFQFQKKRKRRHLRSGPKRRMTGNDLMIALGEVGQLVHEKGLTRASAICNVYSKKKYGQICAKETFRQSINRIWNISIAAALDISASDHSDVRAFKEELVRLLDATIKKVA